MDRNQIIGFSLLAVLLAGYLMYNSHEQKLYEEQLRIDSVAKAHNRPIIDTTKKQLSPEAVASNDSATEALKRSQPPAYNGTAQDIVVESKKLSIRFSTKGAHPVAAQLKDYVTYDKKPLFLFNGNDNFLSAILPIDNGKATGDLYFTPQQRTESNGDKTIDFTGDLGGGKKVDIIYTLPADEYMMRCNIVLTGLSATVLPVNWQTMGLKTEKDVMSQRGGGGTIQVYYGDNKNDKFDYFSMRTDEKAADADFSTNWLGFRKQYFSTVLIDDDGFNKLHVSYKIDTQSNSNVLAHTTAALQLPLRSGAGQQTASLRWYIGPNDYNTLKSYKIGLDNMVPLGVGIMSFVKYINKFAIVPLFYFLSSFIPNYALIIVLMTLLVRVVLSFFTYKSYLSAAKMRVLKPELDELRARIGDDQQKMSMEQMKLYRSAGVNPLGGCLPMVFQIPILLSMYNLFPSFIEFRQKSFLWADDLSTYDSIFNFGFNIPIYGNHISLFTLLMTATSLFLAVYNRNMTAGADQNNPTIKYMPFVMPIIFMGMFNNMAAALTFYYTCSNLLTMAQQFIIQKYFIDEKAIHAQLQQNRNKPATPSKWAARLEEMQKMQAERGKIQPRKK